MLTIEGFNEVLAFNHLAALSCSVMRDLQVVPQGGERLMVGPEKKLPLFLAVVYKVDLLCRSKRRLQFD